MNEIVKKYSGRKLDTDEVADCRNAVRAEVQTLESIDYTTGDDSLLLKWGTLKSWDLHSDNAKELLREYHTLGSSLSAINQHDTPRQKELICQMIDECDGIIQNDWDGEYYTKQQAKKYVMEYGS